MVAQRTADEHLEDSRREADTLLGEAQREAQSMVSEAQREAQTMVSQAQRESSSMMTEAQREAETMVSESRAAAEDLVGQARDKAERMEMEAEQERQKVIGQLEDSRCSLLKNIEELKTFEREYRTRLKLYLESQLRDLNGQQGRTDEEAFEEAPQRRSERARQRALGVRDAGRARVTPSRSRRSNRAASGRPSVQGLRARHLSRPGHNLNGDRLVKQG